MKLPKSRGNTGSSSGLSGAPSITSFPWDFNRPINGKIGCTADTVSTIPSIVFMAACTNLIKVKMHTGNSINHRNCKT
jgi:hypothetical protein